MNITKDNYKLLAVKEYRNPILIEKEFSKDLHLISRVVRRLEKYRTTGELKINMLFNHYITACNCFGYKFVNDVLFLISDKDTHPLIMTWVYAVSNHIDHIVIDDIIIDTSQYQINLSLVDKVKKEFK